ncbi:hypothetical protein Bca4012_029975 [Brassica carinata]
MIPLTRNPIFLAFDAIMRSHCLFDAWLEPISYGFTRKSRITDLNPFNLFFLISGPMNPSPLTSLKPLMRMLLDLKIGGGAKVHGGWRKQGSWRLEDASLVAAGGIKVHGCWKRDKAMEEAAGDFSLGLGFLGLVKCKPS